MQEAAGAHLQRQALHARQQQGRTHDGLLPAQEVGALQARILPKAPENGPKVVQQQLPGKGLQRGEVREEACPNAPVSCNCGTRNPCVCERQSLQKIQKKGTFMLPD